MTDRLKTVYPPKTSFCGGYNNRYQSSGQAFVKCRPEMLEDDCVQAPRGGTPILKQYRYVLPYSPPFWLLTPIFSV